ncbi:hypothetical protein DSLASN_13130 [Desulfoluna limicola]|uniref:Uncharacterized protein n=1 Tax=Desulfoluna limicola TaxID=2810562 RepID=A0ABM7PDS4_9BACT|nr:choice-of-anchor U domain-containing protein [Desulfoluna limicola]BCS95681.1 hypothetical protein DSLASN_13130 [Desulfoluna limicola]
MKHLIKKITYFVPLPVLRNLKQNGTRSRYVHHFMLLVVGLFTGLTLFPSPSSASITFNEAHYDNVNSVDGLENVRSAAVSPDGNHVYTAGYSEDALALFSRDITTGRLTFTEAIIDPDLDGANVVTVSQDGNHVYAAGRISLAVYDRDSDTGQLTRSQLITDTELGLDCFLYTSDVVVSPDDSHVYVTNPDYDMSTRIANILVFERNVTTGLLTFVDVIWDTDPGIDFLYGARSLAVSPDNRNVYVASMGGDDMTGGRMRAGNIAAFSRDNVTGRLTFVQVLKDNVDLDGLWNASSVVVSPDNKHVYVTGQGSDSILTFNRDIVTGLLSFSSIIKNSDIEADCLDGPYSARITSDGCRLYLAAWGSRYAGGVRGAVTAFTRNSSTGELAFEKVMTASDDGIPSLDQVRFITLSPDNGHLYTAANSANAISVFDIDYDQDGTPNNLDDDDDGDNVLDVNDHFPADPLEWEDTDGDGTGNNADTNDDDDGVLDADDAFPLDPLEWEDTDGDRTGNNADTDDDNDGVADDDDAFQLDPSEWKDTDGDGTGDNADTDDDNDGIDDDVEAAAPGNGDGNTDGIKDILQDNVTSLTAHESTEYITLATVSGTTLADCQASGIAAVSDEAPENADFSYGLVNFTINGLTPGAATTATIYLPEGTEPSTYYKYGRTPDNPVAHWYEFTYDGTTGAEINGNVITLHFVDGKRGDNDLIENGVVVDPGGPSFSADDTKPTGGGGCFINSLAP